MGQQQVMQSVELAKELAALDPMLGVHQRLLYVQSGDIVNVLHTSLEILNVALDLIIMEELVLEVEQEEQQLKVLKQKLVVEKQEEQKLMKEGHLVLEVEQEEQQLEVLKQKLEMEKQEDLKQLEK